jgi:hypothetical protein
MRKAAESRGAEAFEIVNKPERASPRKITNPGGWRWTKLGGRHLCLMCKILILNELQKLILVEEEGGRKLESISRAHWACR